MMFLTAESPYLAPRRKRQKVLTMARTYEPKRPQMDACPVENVVALVGGKWKARALYLLSVRPFAFAALCCELGAVSQQVLSTQLKAMQRDGLVRTVESDKAASMLYVVTPKGFDLVKVLMPVAQWGTAELRARG
jgi:DNA-binding HxlR family transcriptional regulator